MAFSDAFARTYAVGDAMKKRRATSKFFEKFKELTDEPPDEVATAIPGMGTEEPAAPAETALPVQDAGADGLAPVVGEEAAAIPVKVQGPKEIPLGDSAEKYATTLTRDNIKELDKLALEAARASGDMEVYKALKDTTVSFLQSKTLSNLSQAQQAVQEGDVDAAEKYLKKAYRYVPDGKEAKFKKKDGALWVANPWAGQEGEPDEVELTAGRIGQLGVMLSDPRKYTELLMQEEKDRAAAKREDKRIALQERGVKTDEARAAEAARHNEASEAIQKQELGLRGREMSLKEASQKYDDLLKVAQAAHYMDGAGKSGAGPGGMKFDDMRQASVAAGEQIQGFLAPMTEQEGSIPGTTIKVRGPTPAGYEMFVGKDGALNEVGLRAQEMAGAIAIHNPELGIPMSASLGMEIARALTLKDGPQLTVSPSNGTITVPANGRPTTVNVPAQMIEALKAASQNQGK